MARTPLSHLALIFAKRCLETCAVSGRINQLILEQLPPHTSRPRLREYTRTIAAIFAHRPKVRRKWLLGNRLPIKAGYGYGIWA